MSERQEFTKQIKAEAFLQAKGRCVRCGFLLRPGQVRYNHRIPCEFGGPGTLENCEVLCLGCDSPQTYQVDIPAIAKSRRTRIRHAGIRKPRTILGGKRFDGSPIRYTRERI